MRTRFALIGISVLVFALLIGIGVWVTAATSSEVGTYFSESWDPRLDLDKDGDVDILDIQMVAAGWQSVAPTPTPLPGGCTAIGGPYFQDTIFPSGCYSVTHSLQVPNAVTMTLQAGSAFYFCSTCNLYVDQTGVLLVQGNDSARVSLVPSGSAWRGVLFNGSSRTMIPSVISGVIIEGVKYYGSGHGIDIVSGALMIDNSIIRNNDYGIGWEANSTSVYTLTRTLIEGNQTGIDLEDWSSSGRISATTNTVRSNSANGVNVSYCFGSPPGVSFVGNNVYANGNYDVYGGSYYGSSCNIDFRNSWWGTTDPAVISQHIWDYYDDITLGKVLFTPFAAAPIPEAP